ncbi:MAG: hypothetical protein KAJ30_03475, partial [Candidatus Heimdallarchaeota archaeon]|nr:hypothetical protein [Candidatus Heimdallarchaeota archaeon]
MKKIKTRLFMSLSVLIIILLVSASSTYKVTTHALLDLNENQNNLDSFDRTDWKWSTTKVISTESTSASSTPSIASDTRG